jgi:hypothetical protein
MTLEDYENDLDARELLEQVLRSSGPKRRDELAAQLRSVDQRFVTATAPSDLIRRRDGLPWLGRIPLNPGPELAEQLAQLRKARR